MATVAAPATTPLPDTGARARERPSPGERYEFLDGLRGVAAFAIVVHHFTALSDRREIFASAYIAVDFFFCLSGFVIALAYHDRLKSGMGLAEYARKRAARLYPMFLTGMVMGFAAIMLLRAHAQTDLDAVEALRAAALNVLYLPYFNADYIRVFEARITGAIFPLNNPAWSLFFGLAANLLFAVSLRGPRLLPAAILVASALGLVAATAAYGEAPGWSSENFAGGIPRVMFAFFAGVVVFQLHRHSAWKRLAHPGVLVAFVLVIVLVPRFPFHTLYWLAGALVLAPAIVALASTVRIERDGFLRTLCRFGGQVSYPLFCIHYPLLMVMSLTPGRAVPFPLLLGLFLAVSITLAWLAGRYLEPPLRRALEGRPRP